ncbi:MAG TPA: O-antigen ligase family protein [Candidatus Mediterraneibacter surreyensis]|nr:O-antigen ligase family protein [Candidatus Mediterraneibacter surreyensis]
MINCTQKDKLKIRFNGISMAFYILIFAQVINRSEYDASVGAIREAFFFSMVLCFAYLLVKKTKKRIIEYIPFALLIVSAWVSTSTSEFVSWNTTGTSLILCICLYVLITWVNLSAHQIRAILKFYSVMTVVISIWILLDLTMGVDILWSGGASIIIGDIRKDPNYLAAFLVPGFAYLLYSYLFSKKKRILILAMDIVTFMGIFFTGSRGAFASALLVILIAVFKILFTGEISVRKILFFLMFLILIFIIYRLLMCSALFERMLNADSYSNNIRLIIWKDALNAFWAHPFIGSGLQAGAVFSQRLTQFVTHNCFLDILTGQGVFASLIYIYIFARNLKVKEGNHYFMLMLLVAFFAPLFFINGYESMTFWLPMMLYKQISYCCCYVSCDQIIGNHDSYFRYESGVKLINER